MLKLFIGVIFVVFGFRMNFGGVGLEFLLAFVGYILMLKGLSALSKDSAHFSKAKIPTAVAGVFSIILFVTEMLSFSSAVLPYALTLLKTAGMLLKVYILYKAVWGISDIEKSSGHDLKSKRLKTVWAVLSVLSLCAYIMGAISFLAFALTVIYFLVCVVFVLAFRKTVREYGKIPMLLD